MNVLTIAGKEFDDAIRSRILLVLVVIFVTALGLVTIGYRLVTPRPTGGTLLVYLIELTQWLVPIAALVAGYDAVVGEREAGTLRLLFGFPYSRGEILLGKALGRFAAIGAPVLAGLMGSALLAGLLYPRVDPGGFVVLLVATVLLTATFVSIAVAVSAASRSAVRVVVSVVGVFVLFLFLWDLVPAVVYTLVTGAPPGSLTPPDWYFFIELLNPIQSFFAILTAGLSTLSAPYGPTPAAYLSGWAAGGILLGWILVPLTVSYVHFSRADLI